MGRRYKNDDVIVAVFNEPPIGTPVRVGSLHTRTLSYVWEDKAGNRKVVVSGVKDNPVLLDEVEVLANVGAFSTCQNSSGLGGSSL